MLYDKLDHSQNVGAQSVCKILRLYRELFNRLSGNIFIIAIIPFYNKNSVMRNFTNLIRFKDSLPGNLM